MSPLWRWKGFTLFSAVLIRRLRSLKKCYLKCGAYSGAAPNRVNTVIIIKLLVLMTCTVILSFGRKRGFRGPPQKNCSISEALGLQLWRKQIRKQIGRKLTVYFTKMVIISHKELLYYKNFTWKYQKLWGGGGGTSQSCRKKFQN
jgi:hypothetical protein